MPTPLDGGALVDSFIAAANTNALCVRATKGWVTGISAAGLTAAVKYLKLYNNGDDARRERHTGGQNPPASPPGP